MPLILSLILSIVSVGSGASQDEKRPHRNDSVVVSAGIPKAQMELEDRLNKIISEGQSALRKGDATGAVKQFETALDLVQKEPYLKERKSSVLHTLAKGYVQADRAPEAVQILTQLLAENPYCRADSSSRSICADARFDLGMAKFHAHDYEGALSNLQMAETGYVQEASTSGDLHEFTALQLRNQGTTNLWIAASLFQLGRTKEAISHTEQAISQLSTVKTDTSIAVGIREDASRSLQQAQTFLKRLQSE